MRVRGMRVRGMGLRGIPEESEPVHCVKVSLVESVWRTFVYLYIHSTILIVETT